MEKTKILGYTDYIPNISVTIRGDMDDELREKNKKCFTEPLLNRRKD